MLAAPMGAKNALVSATYDWARVSPFQHQSRPMRNGVRHESYWYPVSFGMFMSIGLHGDPWLSSHHAGTRPLVALPFAAFTAYAIVSYAVETTVAHACDGSSLAKTR